MTRALTADEIKAAASEALPRPPRAWMIDDCAMWSAAYGAAFAAEWRALYDAIDTGPNRMQDALAAVDVARCKAVADAAVRRMSEP